MKEVSCGTCNMSDYYYLSLSLSTESWLSLAFPQYAIEAQERNEASSSVRRVVGVLEGTFFCTSARMLWVLFVLCSFMAK